MNHTTDETVLPNQESVEEDACCLSPVSESDGSAPTKAEEKADTVSMLQKELSKLREELTEQTKRYEAELARGREREEFSRLFPHVSPSEIPDEVRTDAEAKGLPLAAAYALYEKQQETMRLRGESVNRQNAQRAAGAAGLGTSGEYYTPDEVKRMSPAQVRLHYQTIRESMKKWSSL
ncbi:MAG: hypothetical protein IJY42_06380 [Clostridia bacterium]|nr:hypothetical protein [Clostridia bacterium]